MLWLVAAFYFEGLLYFLGNELAVLGDITDSRNSTFEILLSVKHTVDDSIHRRDDAHYAPVRAVLSSLHQLLHSLPEIPDAQRVADRSAHCPAAPHAVKVPQCAGFT